MFEVAFIDGGLVLTADTLLAKAMFLVIFPASYVIRAISPSDTALSPTFALLVTPFIDVLLFKEDLLALDSTSQTKEASIAHHIALVVSTNTTDVMDLPCYVIAFNPRSHDLSGLSELFSNEMLIHQTLYRLIAILDD